MNFKIVSDHLNNLFTQLKKKAIMATTESIGYHAISNILGIKSQKELDLFRALYSHDIPYIFLSISNALNQAMSNLEKTRMDEHDDIMRKAYSGEISFEDSHQLFQTDSMDFSSIFFYSTGNLIKRWMVQVKDCIRSFAEYQASIAKALLDEPDLDRSDERLLKGLLLEMFDHGSLVRDMMDQLVNQVFSSYRIIDNNNVSESEKQVFLITLSSGFNYFNSLFANTNFGRFSISNNQFSPIESYHKYNIGTIEIDLEETETNFMLDHLLYNLAQNTIDHAFPKTIERKDRKISITGKKIKNGYMLTFSDNGKGMNHEQLKNVFKKGKTSKEGGHNTGMAMYAWKEKLKLMGGTIEVNSEKGAGTVFSIFMPNESLVLD